MAGFHSSSTALLVKNLSWYCSLFLVSMLVLSCCDSSATENDERMVKRAHTSDHHMGYRSGCEEIYVVREGETLHMISEKCGDVYILEENPHIHDPDDVFPGLVIKITPFRNR